MYQIGITNIINRIYRELIYLSIKFFLHFYPFYAYFDI